MSGHTPGPWEHLGQGDIMGMENDPENGCVGPVDVASVYLRTVTGRHDANARLIAAAPDLLEALQYAVKQVPELATVPGIAAAIAKATGEQA